jgi:rhodanese-related sulfurtransferase
VLAPEFLKEAWIDKAIPHVLIDARPAADIERTGFIKGAVAIAPEQIKAALKGFPDRKLKAPIMVYDAHSGDDAVKVAKALVAAKYENVLVVSGGLASWKAAGYAIEQGAAGTKVAYAPKPREGSIPNAEFIKLAANTPPDVLILDVRNQDEANAGMIKGAKLIPDEELAARMAEVPKDRRIITHCTTGVRAEMAYHKLKAAGYNAGFVYATVDVAKDGKVKVTAN